MSHSHYASRAALQTCLVSVLVGCAPESGLGTASQPIAIGSGPTILAPNNNSMIGVQGPVSLSAGPTGWLAVWRQLTRDAGPHIMATRISPTGEVIDQPAIALSTPAVSPSASGFGAWLHDRWLVQTGSGNLLATLPPMGAPTLTPLTSIGGTTASCDDAGCLVVGYPTALRLDASGAAVGAPFALSGSSATAVNAQQWLTVYNGTNPSTGVADVMLNRVLRDGTVRDGAGTIFTAIAGGRTQPSVATDGTSYLVAFVAQIGSGSRTPGLYVQHLDAATSVAVGPPTQLAAGTNVANPNVAWDGSHYWVAWQENDAASGQPPHQGHFVRLAADGTPIDATPRTLGIAGSHVWQPRIAPRAGSVAISWQENQSGLVVFQRFAADGSTVGAQSVVSYYGQNWTKPALATDGSHFALSCQDDALLTAHMWLLDSHGTPSSEQGVTLPGISPGALFWDGARYRGVTPDRTYTTYSQVSLNAAGSAITSATLASANYDFRPSSMAVVRGVTFLDVNTARSGGSPAVDRVSATGVRMDPLPILIGGGDGLSRVLATDGNVLLVVWGNNDVPLQAARVSADGDILDAVPWSLSTAPGTGAARTFPLAAAYGGGVWTVLGYLTSGLPRTMRLVQADASGRPLHSFTLPSLGSTNAALVWNGREFVVALQTSTSGSPSTTQLRVWSVLPNGAVSPPDGLLIDPSYSFAATNSVWNNLSLAALADGSTAIAWSKDDNVHSTRRCAVQVLQPGMGVDAGVADVPVVPTDVPAMTTDVPVVPTDVPTMPTDVPVAPTDVPAMTTDVPVAPTDVFATPDADFDGGAPDVALKDAASDTAMPDDTLVAVDARIPTDATVAVDASRGTDVMSATDRPNDSGSPTTDASTTTDAETHPAADGGCDVRGAGSSSHPGPPHFASISLLAIAATMRRRRERATRP